MLGMKQTTIINILLCVTIWQFWMILPTFTINRILYNFTWWNWHKYRTCIFSSKFVFEHYHRTRIIWFTVAVSIEHKYGWENVKEKRIIIDYVVLFASNRHFTVCLYQNSLLVIYYVKSWSIVLGHINTHHHLSHFEYLV